MGAHFGSLDISPDPLHLLRPPHPKSRSRNPNPVVRERERERKAGGEPATTSDGDGSDWQRLAMKRLVPNPTLPCSSLREAEWEVRSESNTGDDGWLNSDDLARPG